MATQVLARKWRPQSFEAVIGQDNTVKALTQALDTARLHHAYLFTGTRGIGKTSLARLLAKCVCCIQGPSSKPCGQCQACTQIPLGRYLDLMEIDAASRTKVEDTRELLETLHYPAILGHYKIILIDEVHMLSGHSFNALLKTLEEPPEHLIFILATTEPEKLPSTIVSRCLQFHLKPVSVEHLLPYLAEILRTEKIDFTEEALRLIAESAAGSIRDALSLLDQCIAFCEGHIEQDKVAALLGRATDSALQALFKALAQKDAQSIFKLIRELADKNLDFSRILEDFMALLHRLALRQLLEPEASYPISAECLQLYYQIALIGRRDLPLAPDLHMGFEMIFIRLLAFSPVQAQKKTLPAVKSEQESPFVKKKDNASSENETSIETYDWHQLVPQLNLSGLTLLLANHCTVLQIEDSHWTLGLDKTQAVLFNSEQEKYLSQALSTHLAQPIQVQLKITEESLETPSQRAEQQKTELKLKAEQELQENVTLKQILEQFHATIVPNSIKSYDRDRSNSDQV